MRVTNNMLINNMMRSLHSNLRRLERVHNQMSSGKRFSAPSDDPVGVARSLKLRADLNENRQFKKNAEDALSWLETTETALMHIKEVLQRTRELAIQGANGVLSPGDSQKIAEEVTQLRDHLLSIGNSTYAGKYIFAGNKTDQAPVELDPDGSLIYSGDSGHIMYQVGVNDILKANMIAPEIFCPGTNDLLADMQSFINALNAGDSGTVGGIIGDIDVHMENILAKVAEVGAKVNRMELVVNRMQDEYLNFNRLLSQTEDVDMAEVITQLKNEENIYMAALAGGARIIQPSLVDFLR